MKKIIPILTVTLLLTLGAGYRGSGRAHHGNHYGHLVTVKINGEVVHRFDPEEHPRFNVWLAEWWIGLYYLDSTKVGAQWIYFSDFEVGVDTLSIR